MTWSKYLCFLNAPSVNPRYTFFELTKRLFRKKHKRLSSVTVELRQIFLSLVIAERKGWYANVQQQPVTGKKYILDWLKESSKSRGIMTMSDLLKTNFMPTALPFQVIYGKWKKEKMQHQLLHGSLTNCENIFQYNNKVFVMPPRETSNHFLSISGWTT